MANSVNTSMLSNRAKIQPFRPARQALMQGLGKSSRSMRSPLPRFEPRQMDRSCGNLSADFRLAGRPRPPVRPISRRISRRPKRQLYAIPPICDIAPGSKENSRAAAMSFVGEPYLADVFISYSHGDVRGTGDANFKQWSKCFWRELQREFEAHDDLAGLTIFFIRATGRARASSRSWRSTLASRSRRRTPRCSCR